MDDSTARSMYTFCCAAEAREAPPDSAPSAGSCPPRPCLPASTANLPVSDGSQPAFDTGADQSQGQMGPHLNAGDCYPSM